MEKFNDRLLYLFEKFSLNASSFADKIGVQRSSLSHILSGRNKPSLDLILKIYETFPEISLPWLSLGEGDFYKINSPSNLVNHPFCDIIKTDSITPSEEIDEPIFEKKNSLTEDETTKNANEILESPNASITKNGNELKDGKHKINNSEIEQIMIFYKDGTFKTYHPK